MTYQDPLIKSGDDRKRKSGDDTRLGNFRIYSRNSSLEILVRNSSFRNFRLGNSRLRILDLGNSKLRILDLGILEFP